MPDGGTATDAGGTPPGASATPGALNPEIYCTEDGKTWREKFYGKSGAVQQLEQEHAKTLGAMEQTLSQKDSQLTQLGARIAVLEKAVSDTKVQADQLPALQQQIQTLTEQAVVATDVQLKAQLADRYRLAMDFPGLLGLRVEQKEKDKDSGEERVVGYTNPVLTLIEKTPMDGDELRKVLLDLASQLPMDSTAAVKGPMSTTTIQPPNPTPSTDNDIDSWRKKMDEARMKYNESANPQYLNEYDKARAQYEELKRKSK